MRREPTPTTEGFTFRPALQLMGGRLVGFVATFFVPIVLVRVFAPEVFGTYKQLFLIYGTVFPLAQIGMAESLYYFLPTARRRAGRYLLNAAMALGSAGLVCFVALTLGRGWVATWMNNADLAGHLPLIGLYLLLMLVAAVLEIGLVARERYRTAAFTYAGSDLLRAALLLAPAVLFGSLRWLIYGAVAFAGLRLLGTLGYLGGGFRDDLEPSRRLFKAQVAYAAPFQLAVVLEIVQANVHHFAVSSAFDVATYAIYAVGCLQIPLVDLAASSVCNVMMVKMREASRAGLRSRVLEIWHSATRKLALIFVPLTALLVLVARDFIVLLFTEEYAAAVPVFIVWALFILLSVLQTDSVLRVYAETRFLAVMNLARLIVVVASISLLMGWLGLPGAVLATVLATVVGKGMALARMGGLLEARIGELLPWRQLATVGAAAALAAIPAGLLDRLVVWPEIAELAAVGTTYAVAYLMALLALDVLDDQERALMTRWLERLSPLRPRPGLSQAE